jgi:threonyl-tRNA synthetase
LFLFQVPEKIKITLLDTVDGKVIEGESWRTTPMAIMDQISKGLVEIAVVAKVNGEVCG